MPTSANRFLSFKPRQVVWALLALALATAGILLARHQLGLSIDAMREAQTETGGHGHGHHGPDGHEQDEADPDHRAPEDDRPEVKSPDT
ncbi:MAG: hypothetical protein OER86_11310 [Phycisphaerae bacterium]|nr:hypothetical protein [Phycisphaerae bacterium]